MSSWVSHFRTPPRRVVGLGMNAAELRANPLPAEHVVHDLNADPVLPFEDEAFDDATCCVSVWTGRPARRRRLRSERLKLREQGSQRSRCPPPSVRTV